MGRSAGTGYPLWFRCPVQRRERVWPHPYPSGHETVRTGRTKPNRSRKTGASGGRALRVLHEYRCSCGHVGWTSHVGILNRPKSDRGLAEP